MKVDEEKWYAGIDLHRHYSHVTIMDKQGYIQNQQRFENSEAEIIPAPVFRNTSPWSQILSTTVNGFIQQFLLVIHL